MITQNLARKNMVYNQVRPYPIRDHRLLDALLSISRENFLPPHLKQFAYMDDHLLYLPGRYLLAPRVFAQLVEHAAINEGERVLVIGCGSGYSLAVLESLCKNLVGVESVPELVIQAKHLITGLNILNATVIEAPLTKGYPQGGPYNCILIEGGTQLIPPSLFEQLTDKGRLLTIEQRPEKGIPLGRGVMYIKSAESIGCRELFEANVPILPEFISPSHFQL